MKKHVLFALSILTALSLVSGSALAESAAPVFSAPGTYTASAAGRNGDVTVTAEFDESSIVSIDVTSEETPEIGVTAMDQMKDAILSSQSLNVDTVAGATMSSDAFLKALEETVISAGGDVEALKAKEAAAPEASDEELVTEADIIVVGAGAAGMTAAITASDEGASVILLEKSARVGGNTICAANGINAADSDVQLADEAYQETGASVDGLIQLQMNNDDADEALVRAFAENSGETINWMSDLGVNFEVSISNDERNKDQNYYMLQARENGTTALTMVNAVNKALENTDVQLYLNMEATDLITDENGTVTGVKALDTNGNEVDFTGKAVVLCTGGFGQNSELVGEVNPALANAVTDEVSPTTGQGLEMALELGAATANLDAIQTFPAVIPGYGMILPFNLPGGFTPDALYVNNSAERFTAEGFEIPDAILAQDKGEVYCILREENLNDGLRSLYDAGYVVSGETPEELAEALGLDGDALKATIDAFNEDIADGTDDAFGRQENLNPIEGTLYGYRFGVGAHYFMGGILINDQTQVVKEDGSVIDGLYAAGEVTGGFHGTFRVDGSGLGDSFVFGRIAGRETAAAVAAE